MKETKNFDKWIGILSISVICIVAIVFVLMISDTHLAKGTYGVDGTCADNKILYNGGCYDIGQRCNTSNGAIGTITEQGCVTGTANNSSSSGKSDSSAKCVDGKILYMGGCYDIGQRCSTSNGAIGTITEQGCVTGPVNSSAKPSSSSCEKLDRGKGCYTCGLGTSAATTNYLDNDPDKGMCNGTQRCTKISDDDCSSVGASTGITPKTVVLKNAEGTSNNGSFLVDRNNNQITAFNPITNCGTWSTTPCADGNCNTGASAQNASYSGLGVGKTYTGPAVLYCYAGSSIHPTNPTSPSASSVKPSSSFVKPSSVSSKSESTVPSNPPTGTTGIIIAWIIGLFAIGYSFWYFKRTSTN